MCWNSSRWDEEADAAVVRPGSVAAGLGMRGAAALVGDPLAIAGVEQHHGIGRREIVPAVVEDVMDKSGKVMRLVKLWN